MAYSLQQGQKIFEVRVFKNLMIKCPACTNHSLVDLETINLDLQHGFYAPYDEQIALNLSEISKSITPGYCMKKCSRCELEFAEPLRSPPAEWYEKAYTALALYPSSRWEFKYATEQVDLSKKSWGEIGCGSGSFLDYCRSKEIECSGLDFSQAAILSCKSKGLNAEILDVSKSSLEESVSESRHQVIFSAHTLEHLEDPNQLFKLAWHWASDKATLWISVPSDKRPTRIFKEVDFLDQPPHHMTRWTQESLEKIGIRNKWQLVEFAYEPINLKTIIWYYTTRNPVYKSLMKDKEKTTKTFERSLRFLLYPSAYLNGQFNRTKISGFSMLAKFSKVS